MILGYRLKRDEDGKYVTRPGSDKSYTTKLDDARIFASRADAEAEACGNETIVPLTTKGKE